MTLNDEMKAHERQTRSYLTPKTYTVIRLDGKAFHTYTKGMQKPYDQTFMDNMDQVAATLCKEVFNTKFAYVQSDEISLIVADWDPARPFADTQAYFGGQIQKITSVSSAVAAATLNFLSPPEDISGLAYFDSRVFNLPTFEDVESYVIWRMRDARKNSISMAAYAKFSSKSLIDKSSTDRLALLEQAGSPWEKLPQGFRHGRVITRETFTEPVTYLNKRSGESHTVDAVRSRWTATPAPDFQGPEGRAYLRSLIPQKLV